MNSIRSGILAAAAAVALVFAGTSNVAFAETETPVPTPVPTVEATQPPVEERDAVQTEAPATETPATEAPSTPVPSPSSPETSAPATDTPQAAESAALSAVTNIPSLSIDLPDGYTLEYLNESKDEVPADPDVEPHAIVNLVDPANAANDLVDVTLEEIKGRGNFTWGLEKKPYQIKFDASTPVLGLPTAKTWILLANHADTSLLRNKTAYDLAVAFGLPASPDSRFVDVTIEGEFLGNYLLTEKVEVKKNRLELVNDAGVLLELDNNYGIAEDFYFTTDISRTIFVLKDAVEDVDDPLPPVLEAAWADSKDYLNEFESYLYAADPDWGKISSMIDVESFIKYYFVFEVGENPEITQSSIYFYRDGPTDVLHAGPVWDFDSALASYREERFGGDPVQDYVKNAQILRNQGNGWFVQLFRNEEFVAQVNQVFEDELEAAVTALPERIDEYAADIAQSAAANFARWDVLGEPSVFGSRGHIVAETWEEEVAYLRAWVVARVEHLSRAYGVGMPVLKYASHVANIGWQPTHTGGQIVGTIGRSLQLEALDVGFAQGLPGTIEHQAHVEQIGWSGWQDDARLGTTGRALQLEAMRFRLTGDSAATYDIEYRAHVQNIGWMGWVKNGATAGTTGRSLQIEAVQIRLVEKSDSSVDGSIEYGAHVANLGWLPIVADGAVAGTTGQSLRLEALKIERPLTEYAGDIRYRAHVQNVGWGGWADSSNYIGTVGRALRMEAFEVELTGELAAHYSIRYRAHVQDIGWQDWVTDGTTAGTTGQSRRIEAVMIELAPKPPQ